MGLRQLAVDSWACHHKALHNRCMRVRMHHRRMRVCIIGACVCACAQSAQARVKGVGCLHACGGSGGSKGAGWGFWEKGEGPTTVPAAPCAQVCPSPPRQLGTCVEHADSLTPCGAPARPRPSPRRRQQKLMPRHGGRRWFRTWRRQGHRWGLGCGACHGSTWPAGRWMGRSRGPNAKWLWHCVQSHVKGNAICDKWHACMPLHAMRLYVMLRLVGTLWATRCCVHHLRGGARPAMPACPCTPALVARTTPPRWAPRTAMPRACPTLSLPRCAPWMRAGSDGL